MTKVSVIIPAYNQARFLGQAIRSVLEQIHTDFEIVVVDDGSTDDTRNVVLGFADDRISYIYQENRGLSAARNTGLRNTSSPYLTFLDSDDQFLPEKLALLSSALDKDKTLGLVGGVAIPVDESGRQVGEIFDTPIPEDPVRLLLGNPLHVGCVMLRRSWQEKVGYFDENLRSYEDWDMWLRLVRAGCKMGWIGKPVSYYRFHGAQMTRIGNQMTAATFAVLDKVYSDPDLPQNWQSLRNEAYSSAFLRATAQAYLAADYHQAKQYLRQAVELRPDLLDGEAIQLANIFRSWIDLPKVRDSLGFLEGIYANLPENLGKLKRHEKANLGKAAMQLAFDAYGHKQYQSSRRYARRAFRYQPGWLLHRGALAMYVRAMIRQFGTSNQNGESD